MAGNNTNSGLARDTSLQSNGPKTSISVWCLFSLASLFLLLRFYSKGRRPRRGFWWDDYVLVASWIFQLVSAVQISIIVANGFGLPWETMNADQAYRVGLGSLVVGTMMILATTGSKTSFILTLVRISTQPQLTVALCIAAATMNLFHAATIVVQWAQCQPLERAWRRILPDGDCIPATVDLGMLMASTAYSGVIELSLPIVSWYILNTLHIRRDERIGITLVMSMGVFAALTAFIKIPAQAVMVTNDLSYDGANLIILSTTESTFTIIAASLPMLRTLVRDLEGYNPKPSAQGPGRFEDLQLQRRPPGAEE